MLALQDVKLSDLQKSGVLGSGAFGQVMLVKYEGQYMALKTLSKQQILEMGLQASLDRDPLENWPQLVLAVQLKPQCSCGLCLQ